MKTRDGFVSNSSSSSFIVGFAHVPASVEEMRKLLYGEKRTWYHTYQTEAKGTTLACAMRVLADLIGSELLTMDDVYRAIGNDMPLDGDYNTHPCVAKYDFPHYRDYTLDAYREHAHKEACIRFYDGEIAAHPELTWYVFEYEDTRSTVESELEHGGTFKNLVHFQFSHH